ncbi:MAG: anaerobic sulfatase-maturation protein [Bacteroidaceae bacterium]|nr:anaerobic sulfatase-maturation protein [Bacteroidaceae bacterium]
MKSNRKNNYSLTDIAKMRRAPAFSTMVKPIGSACNLDCNYCYYRDKAEIYSNRMPLMSEQLLEEYIKQYLQGVSQERVSFCWHGGEPLMAGLPFYRKAIELQKRYCGDKEIENTLQTNGILLNEEWCEFFRENNFLIGISLDGPQDIHDAFRRDCGGSPTFDKVVAAVQLMARMGVEYNILTTVNSRSEGRGAEVYKFLRQLGNFIQFLPVVEYVRMRDGKRPLIVSPDEEDAVEAPWSVSAAGYGKFMCDVFDEWVKYDVGRHFVQLFDVTLANWCGVQPGLCSFCETCGDGLLVEHNGDVYSCDHFVYPEYCLGNIMDKPLSAMYGSDEQQAFGRDKREALPMECKRCNYYFLCRGECPKHRFEYAANGEPYKNVLCEGYKMFFRHTDPYMRYMKTLLDKGEPASLVMQWKK